VDFQKRTLNENCKNGGLDPSSFAVDKLPGLLKFLNAHLNSK